jgi:hypothetical protein
MPPPHESALESCQRVETILREVQRLVLDPGTETLAQCETELGQVATLLEAMRESITEERPEATAPWGNAAIRQALQEIRRMTGKLKAQFEHGSNYCMGLLQVRLGTGYSEQGLPVLIPNEARSSFEG